MRNNQTDLPPIDRDVLTIEEAADVLRIARSTAYAAARAGDIPTIKIGRRLLVPTRALRRMLEIPETSEGPAANGTSAEAADMDGRDAKNNRTT